MELLGLFTSPEMRPSPYKVFVIILTKIWVYLILNIGKTSYVLSCNRNWQGTCVVLINIFANRRNPEVSINASYKWILFQVDNTVTTVWSMYAVWNQSLTAVNFLNKYFLNIFLMVLEVSACLHCSPFA